MKCPCGAELNTWIKKPSGVVESVKRLKCGECESQFLVICSRKNQEYLIKFELLEISDLARSLVQWRIDNGEKPIERQRGLKGFVFWITRHFRF